MDSLDKLIEQYNLSDELANALRKIWKKNTKQTTVFLSTITDKTVLIGPEPLSFSFDLDEKDSSFTVVQSEYQDLGCIANGGMGSIRRVFDSCLNRSLAMKVIHPELNEKTSAAHRFFEEAQICAQLQHPNIVPIYTIGRLDDGRLFFTMREVKGRDLRSLICELHGAIENKQWKVTPNGLSLHRIIDIFRQVCDTISYAHDRGVIHRDLKPENIMIGEYGEVLVLDWGIAKVMGTAERPLTTHRSQESVFSTSVGQITGTPPYMPPEQARGRMDLVNERSDIYSLGAILYEILSGQPPYNGPTVHDVISRVISSPPPPLTVRSSDNLMGPDVSPSGPALPEELVETCQIAMARDSIERFSSARELSKAIQSWLDGSKRTDKALEMVRRAKETKLSKEKLDERVQGLLRKAQAEHKQSKIRAWRLEDEAQSIKLQAQMKAVEWEFLLHSALSYQPDLIEAHSALAEEYKHRHFIAEAQRDQSAALQAEALLRRHAGHVLDDQRREYIAYLKGEGKLSVQTKPSDARLFLEKFKLQDRQWVCSESKFIGRSPLLEHDIPMGYYRIRIELEGYVPVLYPIYISRQLHWNNISPESNSVVVVRLPPANKVSVNECLVPAGWFIRGGDPLASNALPKSREWVQTFVMQKYPVTNKQYIEFLNDLLRNGFEEEALKHVPRTASGAIGEIGPMIYGRDEFGMFHLRPDADGDMWELDWPVMMVDWYGACAYAKWRSNIDGLPWRLSTELEWEKAARGVDGRYYPWGDHFDPTWACMRDSHHGKMLPSLVTAFPVDVSPYGVRGMGGNMMDWTATQARPSTMGERQLFIYRGGGWTSTRNDLRCARRHYIPPNSRRSYLGFRLVRSYGDSL